MDISRFSGALGGKEEATHTRLADYVKPLVEIYAGIGFTAREEWIVEQALEGLRLLLKDVRCTDDERQAIETFLRLASEPQPGRP